VIFLTFAIIADETGMTIKGVSGKEKSGVWEEIAANMKLKGVGYQRSAKDYKRKKETWFSDVKKKVTTFKQSFVSLLYAVSFRDMFLHVPIYV